MSANSSPTESADLSLEIVDGDETAAHVLLQDRVDFGAGSATFGKFPEGILKSSEKYAWDEDVDAWDEDLDVEALKKELSEQERLVDNHSTYLSGNEAELEGMIKMLRTELDGCREQRWRMEEASELSDFKDQLLVSMVPPQAPSGAGAGAEQEDEAESTPPHPQPEALDFTELEDINSELDAELNNLMSKLGQVKGEFAELNEQRQRLLEELNSFAEEEDDLLGSLDEERAALEQAGEEAARGAGEERGGGEARGAGEEREEEMGGGKETFVTQSVGGAGPG